MSQWTHLCGVIRLDALGHQRVPEAIKKAFGNTVSFNDSQEVWEKCDTPCGSEGSVQYGYSYTGYENKRGGSLSWGLVYLWGDLRNYDNAQEIEDWIRKALDELLVKYIIFPRDAFISIEVEFRKTVLLYYLGVDKDSKHVILGTHILRRYENET